jgi:hypothetical protein
MAVGLNSTLANGWLNTLRSIAFTAPAAAYIKLHIGDPGAAGATAPSTGSATRVVITLTAASAGSLVMTTPLPVWTNGGVSETLSHITWWDAITAGAFQLSGALTTPQAWASGNTFTLSSLSVSLSPIAA